MGKLPKRKPKLWRLLTLEDKKGVVRTLLKAGYTREAIGNALGTTKNAIVGFQHRNLPKLSGKSDGTLEVVPEELLRPLVSSVWPDDEPEEEVIDEVDATILAEAQVQATRVAEARRPKFAASEATQCGFHDPEGHRCGLVWTDPVTKRCDAHKKRR